MTSQAGREAKIARIKAAAKVGEQVRFMQARGGTLEGYKVFYRELRERGEGPGWTDEEVEQLHKFDVEKLAELKANYAAKGGGQTKLC